ncbi:MAG: hypothetical protein BAA02_04400 [Paenibacillaceae bacterium ZCTH02-B3]|nr:MAG: hypothetical protein BAA02_04400 [Paenibacillaceae bacterium ZCTH02-B3]
MTNDELEALKHPVGRFAKPGRLDAAEREKLIAEFVRLPGELREAVLGLDDEQLDTPYRPGGWTVRQVVHHTADTAIQFYTRVKLALTEERPTISPFDQEKWAELVDSKVYGIGDSLMLLEALFRRWERLWRTMGEEDFRREYIHPASGAWTMDDVLALTVFHTRHHTAQIASLRRRMGW